MIGLTALLAVIFFHVAWRLTGWPAWAGLNAATLLVLLAGLTLWGALTWVLVREAGHERRPEPAAVADE